MLTETGLKIFGTYLDILAISLLSVIFLAVLRRWVFTANRLRFDLTQKREAAIILALIALLMISTIVGEAFYVASKSVHSHSPIGNFLGDALSGGGFNQNISSFIYQTELVGTPSYNFGLFGIHSDI